MLYDKYKEKISKLMKIKRFIKKHIIAFVSSLSIVITATVTFMSTYGMITKDISSPININYGETLKLDSQSLFNEVSYEYREINSELWTEKVPIIPGDYEVRTVSNRIFGLKQYGTIQPLKILPKNIDVVANVNQLPYGDKLGLKCDLSYGDYVDSVEFDYFNTTSKTTLVKPILSSIVIKNKDDKVVTDYYTFNGVESNVEFVKRKITISTLGSEKQFDRNPINNDKFEVTSGTLAYEDYIVPTFVENKETKVGTYKNKAEFKILSKNNEDMSYNYDITPIFGDLKIIKRDLCITTSNGEFIYSGAEHDLPEFDKAIGLLDGDKVYVKSSTPYINCGNYENKLICGVKDKNDVDITEKYNISYELGTLTINKKPITIESIDKIKEYDGQVLKGDKYQITKGDLVSSHKEIVTFDSSIIDTGKVDNIITVKIVDENNNDMTSNYNITTICGSLEVGKRKLYITTASSSKEYDAKEFFDESITYEKLLSNHTIKVIENTKVIDAGIYDNTLKYSISDDKGIDVTNNYQIEEICGQLNVLKKKIDFVTKTYSKIYDNTPLKVGEFDQPSTLITGHNIVITGELNSITNFGSILNEFTYDIIDSNSKSVLNNYEVNNIFGNVSIDKRVIKLSSGNSSKIYDDLSIFNDTYTLDKPIENEGLLSIHNIKLTNYPSFIHVGNHENILEFIVYDALGNDVSINYDINGNWGFIEIKPRPITLTTGSASKVYDDKEISNETYEISASLENEGLLINHKFNVVDVWETFKDAQTKANKVSYSITKDTIDVTHNYNVIENFGILEIKPRPITLTTGSASKVYDGKILENKDYQLSLSGNDTGLLSHHKFEVSSFSQIINAETVKNSLKYNIIDINTNVDNTHNYDVIENFGTLEIKPRPITIKTDSLTKVYDDVFVCLKNYTVTPYGVDVGILPDENFVITSEFISIRDAGKYINSFNYEISKGNKITTSNYKIVEDWGIILINPRPLTITTGSCEYEYDDLPHSFPTYSITSGTLVNTHNLIVDEKSWMSFIDAGIYQNSEDFSIERNDNSIVTYNYDIKYDFGKITILKRKIEITTDSSEKIYDDLPLNNTNYKITNNSLLNNHKIEIVNYTEIIDAQCVDNVLNMVIRNNNNKDVTHNYEITFIYGKLNIKHRLLYISTDSLLVIYDGNPHSMPGHTLGAPTENEGLINTHVFIPNGYRVETDAINTYNDFEFTVINKDKRDVTHNYNVNANWGDFIIVPRDLNILTGSGTKQYDGISLKVEKYSLTFNNLVLDHYLMCADEWKSFVKPGIHENVNTFIVLDGKQQNVTHNYNINVIHGFIEITAIKLEISSHSDAKKYDGTPLTNNQYTWIPSQLLKGHKLIYTNTGSQTEIGDSKNTFKIKVVDSNNIDVTDNYQLVAKLGTLEVYPEKRIIKIYPLDTTKEYDGEVLYAKQKIDFEKSSPILKSLYSKGYRYKAVVEGSQTEIGESQSTIKEFYLYDENGRDVTNDFKIQKNSGKVAVTKTHIIVKTPNAKKQYDGTPLEFKQYYVDCPRLASGDQIICDVIGSITEPGSIDNNVNVKVINKYGEDVTHNYHIEKILGKLKIYLPGSASEFEPIFGFDELDNEISNSGFGVGNPDLTPIKPNNNNKDPLLYIESDVSANLYLKNMSFGDYKFNSWGKAKEYTNIKYDINPMFLSTLALIENGYDVYDISFTHPETDCLFLPYYSIGGPTFLSDCGSLVDKKLSKYSYKIVPYEYDYHDEISLVGTKYEEYEKEYYNFVLNNYLQIPSSTKEGMLKIASVNNLDPNSPNIVNEVATYIQNACYYNLDFPTYPFDEDYALYFLNEVKQGLCQHYATAAVCMYRSLGIPARYTVGYLGRAIPFEKSEIDLETAHAWVEVYIKGFGWINVEATGGGFAGFNAMGPILVEPTLELIPVDVDKEYDGTPLYPKNKLVLKNKSLLKDLIDKGYKYKVTIEGQQTKIGTSKSKITSFVLYDKFGKDVTNQYKIIKREGNITVTKPQIILIAHSYQKFFDGIGYNYTKDDVTIIGNKDVTVDFTITGSLNKTGKRRSKIENVVVKNSAGTIVNDDYLIKIIDGYLEITKIPITIKTGSGSKKYDGTALHVHEYLITFGELNKNHSIKATFDDNYIDINKYRNEFKECRIIDQNGKDVTYGYSITFDYGTIEILP